MAVSWLARRELAGAWEVRDGLVRLAPLAWLVASGGAVLGAIFARSLGVAWWTASTGRRAARGYVRWGRGVGRHRGAPLCRDATSCGVRVGAGRDRAGCATRSLLHSPRDVARWPERTALGAGVLALAAELANHLVLPGVPGISFRPGGVDRDDRPILWEEVWRPSSRAIPRLRAGRCPSSRPRSRRRCSPSRSRWHRRCARRSSLADNLMSFLDRRLRSWGSVWSSVRSWRPRRPWKSWHRSTKHAPREGWTSTGADAGRLAHQCRRPGAPITRATATATDHAEHRCARARGSALSARILPDAAHLVLGHVDDDRKVHAGPLAPWLGEDSDTLAGTCARYGTGPPRSTRPPSSSSIRALCAFESARLRVRARWSSPTPRASHRGRGVPRHAAARSAALSVGAPLRAARAVRSRTPSTPSASRDIDRYDSEIAAADAAIGEIVGCGAARRPGAVVIVTADHGEEFGEHGGRYHGTTVYEEQVRVPLIVATPGLAPRRVETPVQTIDFCRPCSLRSTCHGHRGFAVTTWARSCRESRPPAPR